MERERDAPEVEVLEQASHLLPVVQESPRSPAASVAAGRAGACLDVRASAEQAPIRTRALEITTNLPFEWRRWRRVAAARRRGSHASVTQEELRALVPKTPDAAIAIVETLIAGDRACSAGGPIRGVEA